MPEWNYRVVRIDDRSDWPEYDTILEVHYDETGRPAASCPIRLQSDTVENLRALLRRIEKAMELPVLSKSRDF